MIKKVSLERLSYVCIEPRNKKVFSFIATTSQVDAKDCYTFSGLRVHASGVLTATPVKGHAKRFPEACSRAITMVVESNQRAEAEAALVGARAQLLSCPSHSAAATAPIIPRLDVDDYHAQVRDRRVKLAAVVLAHDEQSAMAGLVDPGVHRTAVVLV